MAPKGSPGSSGQGREGCAPSATGGPFGRVRRDVHAPRRHHHRAGGPADHAAHAACDFQGPPVAHLGLRPFPVGADPDPGGRWRTSSVANASSSSAWACSRPRLACGLSTAPAELIAARAVQGVGGAAMFATSLALIGQDFQGTARRRHRRLGSHRRRRRGHRPARRRRPHERLRMAVDLLRERPHRGR